ncbi:MAG: alpha/beta hydrolase [Frankiaceae bacterium]|nr:alpha/beta hydrolase [Frankiaceae bacterium]
MTETPLTLRLPDGRTLAWYEYGDAAGLPCVYATGTPASGLAGKTYDKGAAEAGARWISVDKPGYGHSDLAPGRTLLQWTDDVRVLVDHLGLDRFAVAGESGGGPYALALAHALPERITTAIVIAGLGPGDDPRAQDGMKRANKLIWVLAKRAPWAVRLAIGAMARTFTDEEKAQRYLAKQIANAPAADRAAYEDPEFAALGLAATRDAFRTGTAAAVAEMGLLTRALGFRLEDISTHVDLFHGEQDANVPVAVARRVAAALPNCDPRFYPELGHMLAFARRREVLDCVRAAV